MPGRSVIFSIDFEVTLRMGADGADFRRFRADNNVSAVTAFPDFDTAFFEYFGCFHIPEKSPVAFLMVLFNCSDPAEFGSEFRKSFSLCGPRKALVHIRPFIVFAVSGFSEILGSAADSVEFLQPQLGMLLLIVSCFEKQRGNLLEAVFFGPGSEIGVFVSGL